MKAKIHSRTYLFSLFVLALLPQSSTSAAALEMELRPQQAKQGQVVAVIIHEPPGTTGSSDTTSGASSPVVQFRKNTYKAFPLEKKSAEAAPESEGTSNKPKDEKVWRVLLAVPADLAPGNYILKSGAVEQPLKVLDASFGVQVIRLPQSKDNFNGSPGEPEAVDAAKATLSPHQYWSGKFIHPSNARTSSPFGLRRRVNGVLLKDYFHSGLDFAGAAGSPVLAAQTGKVIIAHQGWKLHGNTICIDHGQGVVSFYIHLSKILVKEGDIVKVGQKIGAVGSTGRANGPHLHFSVYVNKEASNPGNWFSTEF